MSDDPRRRDDRHLRDIVTEARSWMRKEGIDEQSLDWEDVATRERAHWWRERLRQSIVGLAARAGEFGGALGEGLQRLGKASDRLASAALEVTLDAGAQLGRILAKPAQACVDPGAGLDFSYSSAAE